MGNSGLPTFGESSELSLGDQMAMGALTKLTRSDVPVKDLEGKVLFTADLESLSDHEIRSKLNFDPDKLVPTYAARVQLSTDMALIINSGGHGAYLREAQSMDFEGNYFFVMDVMGGKKQPSIIAVFSRDDGKPMDYPVGNAQFYKVKQ